MGTGTMAADPVGNRGTTGRSRCWRCRFLPLPEPWFDFLLLESNRASHLSSRLRFSCSALVKTSLATSSGKRSLPQMHDSINLFGSCLTLANFKAALRHSRRATPKA